MTLYTAASSERHRMRSLICIEKALRVPDFPFAAYSIAATAPLPPFSPYLYIQWSEHTKLQALLDSSLRGYAAGWLLLLLEGKSDKTCRPLLLLLFFQFQYALNCQWLTAAYIHRATRRYKTASPSPWWLLFILREDGIESRSWLLIDAESQRDEITIKKNRAPVLLLLVDDIDPIRSALCCCFKRREGEAQVTNGIQQVATQV